MGVPFVFLLIEAMAIISPCSLFFLNILLAISLIFLGKMCFFYFELWVWLNKYRNVLSDSEIYRYAK